MTLNFVLPTCAAVVAAAMIAPIPAQQIGGSWTELHNQFGEGWASSLGFEATGLGDIDGDGIRDYAVSSPGANSFTGAAIVYSGATHLEIRRHIGQILNSGFGGVVIGVGDLDLDGIEEVMVSGRSTSPPGLTWAGWATVYRGSDGSILYDYPGVTDNRFRGTALASAGDLNGDGIPEFIFTESGFNPDLGEVFVMDGATGTTILTMVGTVPGAGFGKGVTVPGDLNGDGINDVVVTSPFASLLTAFSGATGVELWSQSYDNVNTGVSGIGDQNSDGIADVVAGAPSAAPNGVTRAGSIYLASGLDGSLILQIDGTKTDEKLGQDVTSAGDIDGDGIQDILAGQMGTSANFTSGSAHFYSTADGSLLNEFSGLNPDDGMGISVTNLGDINGNNRDDFLFGASGAISGGLPIGWFEVWSRDPFLNNDAPGFSAGSGGAINYELDFPNDAAGDTYQTLLSASGRGPMSFLNGVQVPLTFDIWLAQTYLGMYPPVFTNPIGVLDGEGKASMKLSVPPNAANSLVGQIFYLAAACKPSVEQWRYSTISVPVKILP